MLQFNWLSFFGILYDLMQFNWVSYAWGQQVTSEKGWDQIGKKRQPPGKILRSFLLIFTMWGHNGETAIYDSVYIQADTPATKSARDVWTSQLPLQGEINFCWYKPHSLWYCIQEAYLLLICMFTTYFDIWNVSCWKGCF